MVWSTMVRDIWFRAYSSHEISFRSSIIQVYQIPVYTRRSLLNASDKTEPANCRQNVGTLAIRSPIERIPRNDFYGKKSYPIGCKVFHKRQSVSRDLQLWHRCTLKRTLDDNIVNHNYAQRSVSQWFKPCTLNASNTE